VIGARRRSPMKVVLPARVDVLVAIA
jgi:hypothetical protein